MARRKHVILEQTVAAIRRRHGPAALVRAAEAAPKVLALPTGFRSLDAALGIGGLPRGQITEFLGPLTAGKTTLAACLVAQTQRLGEEAAYLDLGGVLDADYLARCGVDLDRLVVVRPRHSHQALEVALHLVARARPGLLVLDAVEDLEASPLDPQWAQGALRQLVGRLRRSPTVFLALHHAPAKEATYPLGFDLGEHAWLRLQLGKVRWLRRHRDVWGYEVEVQVLRHRGGREGKRAWVRFTFNGTVRGGRW